jgi:hypothetical protein
MMHLSNASPLGNDKSMSKVQCAVVLVDGDDSVNFTAELARLLPCLPDMTEVDMRHKIRAGAGLLAQKLPSVEAHKLADNINKAGYKVFCIPQSSIQNVPQSTRISRLRCHPNGIECQVIYRWLALIPWCEIGNIHAYAFAAPRNLRDEP